MKYSTMALGLACSRAFTGSAARAAFQAGTKPSAGWSRAITSASFRGPQLKQQATRAWMTTTATSFDKETSILYKHLAENHKHPSGPWTTMLNILHKINRNSQQELVILDLATGPGEPALLIAQDFPKAKVVASDISPDQIALVQQTIDSEEIPNMEAKVVDMMDLHQFDDNTFDVITCCYGFMFPPDIPLAAKESLRVLKPGGTLIATTWNQVQVMKLIRAVMTDVSGEAPPAPPINPLSLKDPGLFESILTEAGYQDITAEVHTYPFDLASDPTFQFKASMIPVHETLNEMNAWDKAEASFNKHKLEFGIIDERDHYILTENEYKLTVAKKAN